VVLLGTFVAHLVENSGVPLSQISWLVTVGICVVAAILVLVNGYLGYFGVLLAVAAAAGVNLLPRRGDAESPPADPLPTEPPMADSLPPEPHQAEPPRAPGE
jgi:hypothetical protein